MKHSAERTSQMDTRSVSSLIDRTRLNQEDTTDEPDALVRVENRILQWTRSLLAIALLSATAATSGMVLYFLRAAEFDAYEAAFVGIAEKLLISLETDLAMRIWMGISQSSAVTTGMDLRGDCTRPDV